jgi:hypothetical protein
VRVVRPPGARRPGPSTVAGWLGLAGVLTLLGGRPGLALAAAIVLCDLLFAPPPRALLLAGVVALVAVPVVVLVKGLPTPATLSPEFAAGSLLPHLLAGTGLALAVLGTLRDVRAGLPRPAAGGPAAPPSGRALPPPERAEEPGEASFERGPGLPRPGGEDAP